MPPSFRGVCCLVCWWARRLANIFRVCVRRALCSLVFRAPPSAYFRATFCARGVLLPPMFARKRVGTIQRVLLAEGQERSLKFRKRTTLLAAADALGCSFALDVTNNFCVCMFCERHPLFLFPTNVVLPPCVWAFGFFCELGGVWVFLRVATRWAF